jgi:hypothetical protein
MAVPNILVAIDAVIYCRLKFIKQYQDVVIFYLFHQILLDITALLCYISDVEMWRVVIDAPHCS